MLSIQLQRFAGSSSSGEKTERATPRRRQEARREGNVPKSVELSAAIGLLGAMVVLRIVGGKVWGAWMEMFRHDIANAAAVHMTVEAVIEMLSSQVGYVIGGLLPVVLVAFGLSILAGFVQVGPLFVPKLLLPKLNRISPISGVQKLFTARTLVESLKSILKLAIVVGVAYYFIHKVIESIAVLPNTSVSVLVPAVGGIVFQLGLAVSLLMLGLAGLDFFFQRYEYEKNLRMTKQEVKDEYRQMEGDSRVKASIRRRGRALALRRMMQEVPKADVVITNPTHYAVALRYEVEKMSAPRVVAKGQDHLALRIREIAAASEVPIVENRPLARTLYTSVELGDAIPPELYQAVAEILAYVYALKQPRETELLNDEVNM
ncbi:flagellar biosynthesis protein FlhB [Alicyclobacillus sp. SP_1]|uniref:flagellar biosynthesis protein FlhB n=1 Tax=Alicyclobacillus sp. SP_1 TaxID=2942475 RepID=UPI00215730E7|nr:flagellar biosynthesis protein FlhB [Alicyclobacillus sp. SP_1]